MDPLDSVSSYYVLADVTFSHNYSEHDCEDTIINVAAILYVAIMSMMQRRIIVLQKNIIFNVKWHSYCIKFNSVTYK